MPTTAPKTLRETFELLADFDGKRGIREFLGSFDWSNRSVYQIYEAFFDRIPESANAVRTNSQIDPLTLAANALQSLEFQSRSVELLLQAYSDKRRLFHIHIPKTAGTDLREALTLHIPHIARAHSQREVTTPGDLIAHLAETSRRIRTSTEILITGHRPLKWYVDQRLCRSHDRIFSIVRDPIESLLSLANYRLKLIRQDPQCTRHDTRALATHLGISRFPDRLTHDEQYELGIKLLRDKTMMTDVRMTEILGQGTATSAIEYIVRTNIELIRIETYNLGLRILGI